MSKEYDRYQQERAEADRAEDEMVAGCAGCAGKVVGVFALGTAGVAAVEGKWGMAALTAGLGVFASFIIGAPDSTQRMHEANNYGLPSNQDPDAKK